MRVLLTALLLAGFLLRAQTSDDDYVDDNVMKYDDYVYKSNIRTVQFHLTTWEYAAPVIALRGGEQLELSFDDLEGDQKQYTISFVHCNADWTPSDLMISEYLNGYYDLNIINFGYSVNTYQKYTHYSIIFPQQGNVQFTKSGNYILYVYRFGDKKDLVLTRRFMVYDERLQIGATFRQTVGGDDQFAKQQLDFTINPAGYDLTNPHRDMHVVITQNNRWDNAVTDIKPTFMNGQQLVYSLDEKSAFFGGNEFRYFDVRSMRFGSERVKEVYRDQEMRWLEDTVIAVLTLGAQRPWRLRPRANRHKDDQLKGATHDLAPASGDLLVMGGACQARWEHAVPQIRDQQVGERISMQWRWTSKRGRPQQGPGYGAPLDFSDRPQRRRNALPGRRGQ